MTDDPTTQPERDGTRNPSVPRPLHPWAWWGWAVCLGGVTALTTNPLFLVLIAAALTSVIVMRRSDAPWARSVGAYFVLAAVVIGVRLVFQIVLGGSSGSTVLFTLPQVPLPDWAAGLRLGGPVTAEAVAFTVDDGLRLGVMLLCLGAANSLANPRQALRSVPAALYDISVAVVIALSVAPQLIESVQRVRRARRLRGGAASGWRAVPALVVPVLADAIERSMALATSMEARGFARARGDARTWAGLLGATMLATLGVYGMLATSWLWASVGCLLAGMAGTVFGLRRAGRAQAVTRFRVQPWRWRETAVLGCGVVALGVGVALAVLTPAALVPSTNPLVWPELSVGMLLIVAVASVPIALTTPERVSAEAVAAASVRRPLRELVTVPHRHHGNGSCDDAQDDVGGKRANDVGGKRANDVGGKRANDVEGKRADGVEGMRADGVGGMRADGVGGMGADAFVRTATLVAR